MKRIEIFYALAAFITTCTPLYFFIRWLIHKHINNYPLKFQIDTTSLSTGGKKLSTSEGIKMIITSLRLMILNRTSSKRKVLIYDIRFSPIKEIIDFKSNFDFSSGNRNFVNLNIPYEIESKNNIILYLRIEVKPSSPCPINNLKENIRKYLNKNIELIIQYNAPPNIKKHHQSLKVSNFFEELLKLVNKFQNEGGAQLD